MQLQFVERTSENKYTARLLGYYEDDYSLLCARTLPELKVRVLLLVSRGDSGASDILKTLDRVDSLFNALAEKEQYNETPLRITKGLAR